MIATLRRAIPFAACLCAAGALAVADGPEAIVAEARLRGQRFERAVSAMQRVLRVWLTHADARTLLLPDRWPGPGSGLRPGDDTRLYTPHNSGADLYPYLILTAELTDPGLYRGRMMEMLRNEIRYTNTVALDSRQPQSEDRRARPAEHVRRRRVCEGRPAHRHRISRPHTLVLPHGGHGGGRDGSRPGRVALRQAAGLRLGAERRLPPGAGAPRAT